MAPFLSVLCVGLIGLGAVIAHPGHSVAAEAAERREFLKRSPNTVRSCASTLASRGIAKQAIARRSELAQTVQLKRGLVGRPLLARRDFADYNFTHASSKDVTLGSDELSLFEDNSTCILQPEVTQGPYYIDGELIRSDTRETQEGVPLYLDVQLIDTSTCEPVPAVFMDIWHCNATGVYSGVSASGNGDSNDTTNLDNTFLRGIQESDVNGVVQFETIVPGHYTGRAPHIHVLTHNTNDTIVRTNGTLLAAGNNFTTTASHVGQVFFDQSLLAAVSALEPYSTNTQTLTLNSDDDILASEAADMDPFIEYVLIGSSLSDGILAWISIGIDPTTDDSVTSAGTYYESGGVADSDDSMGGGPSGGSGGNGTMPSGSGAPPASPSAA